MAGSGGRVGIWSTSGNHIDEFRRIHPGSNVESIGVGREGDIVVAAHDIIAGTIIDIYRADGEFSMSIRSGPPLSPTDDLRVRDFYGGGSLHVEADGNILYTQKYPYRVQRFSPTGTILHETTDGGAGWIPEPPKPDLSQPSFSLRLTGASIDIRRVGDFVLNNTYRQTSEGEHEMLLTLYNAELDLVAQKVLPGLHSVVGVDKQDRVLVFTREGDVPTVTRYALHVPGRN